MAKGLSRKSTPLEFVVLGSGSFSPGPLPAGRGKAGRAVRNPAGYAVRRGGRVILFDLGFGNLRQMVRAGLDPDQVSHVFFTHRHPDHVGDLAALLFYYRYDGKPLGGRLRVYGPRGFKSFFERLTKAYHPWLRPRGFQLSVEEVQEGRPVKADGWSVRCREVPHSTESVAYRLDCPQGSVCYSGDTAYDASLAVFAAGADVFVVECTLPDGSKKMAHMHVSEALKLAELSGAKRVLFSHLTPESEAAVARRIVRRPGFMRAEDLMTIRISGGA